VAACSINYCCFFYVFRHFLRQQSTEELLDQFDHQSDPPYCQVVLLMHFLQWLQLLVVILNQLGQFQATAIVIVLVTAIVIVLVTTLVKFFFG